MPLSALESDDEPVAEDEAPRARPAAKKSIPVRAIPGVPEAAKTVAAANEKELPWLDSLARGYTQAQRNQKPVFVRAGSESCRFCRALAVTITKPAVQEELKRWTLVEIDVEKSPDDARLLAVGPIPALRLVTATGRLVAEAEGTMSEEELVAWLQKHHDAAAVALPPELADDGPLDAAGVNRLIQAFRNRDAAVREAAIRRLLPRTGLAAVPVVEAFTEGSLAARLAALDVLREWKAPLDGLDPWRPETLTAARRKSLAEWGVAAERAGDGTAASELAPQDLADARDMIDRMRAGPVGEALAIRERLARFGRLLLPEVYARLKGADTDEMRERLTGLRYRLVESENLALNWPGGIERLAAAEVETRKRAADELAARATPADEGLLLELFSDPAPLVREITLRALMQTGGSNVNSALVRLLDDPEPNVRAAVLKQLAESPSQNLTARIAVYAANEKDPDLVVHAIRVLREAKNKTAIAALTSLLSQNSWQVRAEAAEGLGKLVDHHSQLPEAEKTEVYLTLTELLKDADGFVVSRAVNALGQANLVAAVDPLAETVGRHPELAVAIVQALSHGGQSSQRAVGHLRQFVGHADPKIRAAAIGGLCTLGSDRLEQELKTALNDADGDVRIAAANAFFTVLERQRHASDNEVMTGRFLDLQNVPTVEEVRPASDENADADAPAPPQDEDAPAAAPAARPTPRRAPSVAPAPGGEAAPAPAPDDESPPPPAPTPRRRSPAPTSILQNFVNQVFGAGRPVAPPQPVVVDPVEPEETSFSERDRAEGWLRAIRAGKALPKWQRGMRPALEARLSAEDARERAAAVLPLTAIGADDVAVPEMLRLIEADPKTVTSLSGAFPWLLAADRARLLEKMLARPAGTEDLATIANSLEQIRSPAAEAALWDLVLHAAADAGTAEVVKTSLLQFYFPRNYYQLEKASPRDRKRAIAAATERARNGAEWQRLIGLALLLALEAPTALELARPRIDDEALPLNERTDALQIVLLTLPESEKVPFAVNILSSPRQEYHGKVLASLTEDEHSLYSLREGAFDLSTYHSYNRPVRSTSGQPIEPEPPAGLEADSLLPLLEARDPKVAAQAGYLLALLGRPEGLPHLLAYWRTRAANSPDWMRLVYRAVAKLDAGDQVPALKEIYARLNNDQNRYYLSEFYWTIRSMTGPEILPLRKTIRDEIGVHNLR